MVTANLRDGGGGGGQASGAGAPGDERRGKGGGSFAVPKPTRARRAARNVRLAWP